MSRPKRNRKEQAMSEQKKPPEPPKRGDLPAQQPPSPTLAPHERQTGEPTEKRSDAPASTENEQKRVRAEKEALAERKATDHEGTLKPELQKLQAEHRLADPAPAPLIRPPKDEMGQPAQHPPTAPKAGKGDVPRFVDGNTRATPGLVRFRVRADDSYGQQPARYVLARDEEEAKEHYLKGLAIDRLMARLGEDAPDPMLSVTRLPD